MKTLWLVLVGRRDYRLLLTAGLVSLTGDWILRIGILYHVYALTGSTLASGAMLVASFVPRIVLGSLTGVLADRWDRRRLMVITNLVQAGALLPLLLVRDGDDLWILYAVVLAISCLEQLFEPAQQSLVPLLVPSDQLVTANALNGQARDVARLIGAALGGVVIGLGGLTALALTDAASFVLSAVLLASIWHRRPAVPKPEQLGGALTRLRREWAEGLRLCLAGRTLRIVFAFGILTSFGEGVMSTSFAPFVRDVLHGSGTTYGLISSSQAIGGLVGGLTAATVGARFAPVRLWGVGAIAFGLVDLTLFCYPLAMDVVWPAFACMIVVGVPGAFYLAGCMTVLQRVTEDASRGRVFGALIAAEGGATLIGILSAGVLGEVVGIIPVLVMQGVGYVVGGTVVLALLARQPAEVQRAASVTARRR
jgi:Na+/melibiose symporter-like transporter